MAQVTVLVPPNPLLTTDLSGVDVDAAEALAFRQAIGVDVPTSLAFDPFGSGSVDRTLQDKLRESISLLDYAAATDGTNASAAIQAAINAAYNQGGGTVRGVKGVTYSLTTTVEIKANVTLDLEGATLKCTTGATLTHLLVVSSNGAKVCNGTIDGTGMVSPTGAYSFATSPGTGIYITTTSGGNVTGVRVSNILFKALPSGAVLVGGPANAVNLGSDIIIENCRAENVQTYSGNETPGVFHLQACTASYQVNSTITTYNWKGFYVGNGAFCEVQGCYANGGVTGHASHYISGGNDNKIIGGGHEGIGFGFKLFNTLRSKAIGFSSKGSSSMGLIEGGTDCEVSSSTCQDPTANGLAVQGLAGVTTRVVISDCLIKRATAGATTNDVGIFIRAFASAPVDGVYIHDTIIDNFYFGIQALNTTTGAQKNVHISGGSITNSVQYGCLLFVQSGSVKGVRFTQAGALPAVFISNVGGGLTGGKFVIDGNTVEGATVNQFEIATGGGVVDFDIVKITRNTTTGGTNFCNVALNNSTTDRISLLVIKDNDATGLSGNGVSVTFNTTTSCLFQCWNGLIGTVPAPAADSLTNLANVTIEGPLAFAGSPNSVFKAYIGRSTYHRTDGGAATTIYVKESGAGTNTGWVGK